MFRVGYYHGKELVIFYHESENYEYTNNYDVKRYFKINSGLKAVAKAFHDLGDENITRNEQDSYWYDLYQKNKKVYESTIMEHAIGLSCKYKLKKLVNSKGQKLKRYKAYRNYYNISPNCESYEEMQELVKAKFMEEYAPDFFRVTWQGYYWLECKYDLKIIKDEEE